MVINLANTVKCGARIAMEIDGIPNLQMIGHIGGSIAHRVTDGRCGFTSPEESTPAYVSPRPRLCGHPISERTSSTLRPFC